MKTKKVRIVRVPSPPPKLTKTFKEEFAKLNPEQKVAVEHIEGPVICVAGPGTGKTQVVALRVANILRKTHAKPGSILCLTFSVSGARAMRERLREIIGTDAYGVTVSTVHGFCNDLIGSYPETFDEMKALEHISEVEQLRIIREALEKLPHGSVLANPKRLYDRAGQILGRIAQMKREDRGVADLKRVLEECKSTQGERQAVSGKRLATKDADARKIQQFAEFITIYEAYEQALKESHRYDYEDMVLIVLQVLRREEWLLMSLQERYLYVLVDESQDLNRAQYEVIDLLTTSPIADIEPNFFLVGDDDQAIYRFQGATLTNLLSFLTRFPNAEAFPLTKNYRSTQEILDASSTVIAGSRERLLDHLKGKQKIEKRIVAVSGGERLLLKGLPAGQAGRHPGGKEVKPQREKAKPLFLIFETEEEERLGIAAALKRLHEEEKIPYEEMAVLCRRNEELNPFMDVLASAGLPMDIGGKQDLLLEPAVRECVLLLKAVADPENSTTLAAALALPCFAIAPADLGRIWMELKNTNIERGKKGQREESLLGLLLTLTAPSSQLTAAPNLLLDLHQKKALLTLPELLQRLLEQSSLLPRPGTPILRYSDIPEHLAALCAFYNWVKNRCYEDKTLTLERLLEDIELYSSSATLHLRFDQPHLEETGLKLITAHQAKGLEFEAVFVPHFRKGNWGDRRGGSKLALPDHLIFNFNPAMEPEGGNEEELRLAYVAMTRAKRHLILSYAESYQSRDKVLDAEPSSFVAEFGETIEERLAISDKRLVPSLLIASRSPLSAPDDEVFSAFLRERLKTFSLSVTALNRFLEDPQAFLWEDLMSMPRAKEPHLAYGSAVHSALEAWGVALHHKRTFGLNDLLKHYEQAMTEREVLTRVQREGFLNMGKANLRRYFETYGQEKPIVLKTETKLSAHLPGPSGPRDIPLTGIIDRLELLDATRNAVRIVDFKTGRPKTEKQVREDYGGSLYRQLQFYALLCRISKHFPYEAEEFVLDFVGEGDDRPVRRSFTISYEELQDLEKLIRTVWEKITNLDFTPIP
jgi:DNA helicase-2/ATP-dependent DNA helicase PcrA